MGLFGDDESNDSSQSRANDLMAQEISQNEAKLEQKRKSLSEARISIIKSTGGENWKSTRM